MKKGVKEVKEVKEVKGFKDNTIGSQTFVFNSTASRTSDNFFNSPK